MSEINFELKQRETIDWSSLAEMFELVSWGKREPEDIKNSFETSSAVCFVFNKADEIIGFGRSVDDGKYYALLVDVIVHPSYQGTGIGKEIIELLRKQLVGYNFITLTAAPNKGGFYEKIGWKQQSTAYIWPKDEKQQNEHSRAKDEQ